MSVSEFPIPSEDEVRHETPRDDAGRGQVVASPDAAHRGAQQPDLVGRAYFLDGFLDLLSGAKGGRMSSRLSPAHSPDRLS